MSLLKQLITTSPPMSAGIVPDAYRKSHEIDGATAEQTDYQVRVKIHRAGGVDDGEDVYIGTECRENFGDIRFTKSDGITPLDFWLEGYAGGVATFWVEIDSIPASPGTVTIYIYYGNDEATTISDIDATFLFGDDFKFGCRTGIWDARVNTVVVNAARLATLTVDSILKAEGLTRDDDYYFISHITVPAADCYLYKFNVSDGSVADSVTLTDGTLTHVGGIDQDEDGYIYVPLAEPIAAPANPSKLVKYDKDLNLIGEVCNSSGLGNDHFGGVAVDDENDRLYIQNWDSLKIYVYTKAGVYVSTIDPCPYASIQDMQIVNGYLFGSIYSLGTGEIVVIKVSDFSAQGIIYTGSIGAHRDTNEGMCVYTPDKENSKDADFQFYLKPFHDTWGDADKRKLLKTERANLFVEIKGASSQVERSVDYGPDICVRAKVKFTGTRHNCFLCDDWPDGNAEDAAQLQYNGTDWLLRTNIDATGPWTDDTGLTEDTNWHIWDLKWPSGSAKLDFDDSNVASLPDAPAAGMHLGVQNWGSSTTDVQIQFIVVRKYVDPEPSHGVWGAEEPVVWPF